MATLEVSAHMTVRPGQLERFKKQAAELIRITTDPGRTIQAYAGTTSELSAVLDRSCGDCHSNNTVWPGTRRSRRCRG